MLRPPAPTKDRSDQARRSFPLRKRHRTKDQNFVIDPSPSKIVILVDNSQTLPTSVEALKAAVMEFAYEIFDGDQLFVLAYDEKAEIIQEWTDDAKKMEKSLATFRKKGNPYLLTHCTLR